MARSALLQLTEISLGYGGHPLFAECSTIVHPRDRIALVGRNGSGKSTLLKVMAGLVMPDSGTRVCDPDLALGYLDQDPDMSGFATLGDFASAGLEPGESYKVDRAAEGLRLDSDRSVETASGGERRRAALARLLASEPTLMLLDEPTNHLDITAISWLEEHLSHTRAAFIVISHDRAFLRRLTRATLWLDRGVLRRQEAGFDAFETWRDTLWAEEDAARHKLKRKIASEARWAVEGISARRKRNQGRVRALRDLRAERAAQINRQETAALAFDTGAPSGRKVIEARNLSLAFDGNPVIKDFSLTVQRRDRVALVGPNGVGKTTLLDLLLGRRHPDQGVLKTGTNLQPALFDQSRASLDPDRTLWDSLTQDPDMRVSGQSDQVMVRGEPRHVVGYLKDFLFDEARAKAPVRSLSGGEKARLLLARLMARPSNLLVLDEPTNDLDIETLDLLQDILDGYEGTVLLVSHDRDFIDRVATITVSLAPGGHSVIYAGGWTDSQAQGNSHRPSQNGERAASKLKAKSHKSTSKLPETERRAAQKTAKLTFRDQHRLDTLPQEIDRIEREIAKLEQLLSDPALFSEDPSKFTKASQALSARQDALAAAEEEWLTLAEKQENLS
ncbi:MAG: ATP-binding cassette domain-containing protein [Pseudomonadota bacterium]